MKLSRQLTCILLAGSAAAALTACGGGNDPAVAPVATTAGAASAAAAGGVGCTGDVQAFFTKNAGSYPSKAVAQGGTGTVAGIAAGTVATVIVGADCTLKVGDFSLSYLDKSLSPSPGGQIDVSLTGPNSGNSTYEVFGDGTGLTSLNDTRTKSFMNFFLPKK